jgi:hypothetical protein
MRSRCTEPDDIQEMAATGNTAKIRLYAVADVDQAVQQNIDTLAAALVVSGQLVFRQLSAIDHLFVQM